MLLKILFYIKNNKTILIFLIRFKLLIESWIFDVLSIFFITVPYMVSHINESHIFGQ